MKLYVAKDCEDSLITLVALKQSAIKATTEIVPQDSKHIPYLKATRQVPSLLLDSGDYIFSLHSILLYLLPVSGQDIKYLARSDIDLAALNKDIPPLSFHGENEKLNSTDMILWSRLYPTIRELERAKSWYSQYPKVAFWFDKVHTVDNVTSSIKELSYTGLKNQNKARVPKPSVEKSALIKSVPVKPVEERKEPKISDAVENFLQVNVPAEKKADAKNGWAVGWTLGKCINDGQYPKRPIPGQKNNLITSALPYVNNVPHLGNIIGCVLSADCYARYCRLKNENTLYICGTDEYGTATETKALAEGVSPQQICDKYHALHSDIYSWFNIGFDFFGRTTTKQQTTIAQDIFWKVHNNGYTVEQTVDQLYCTACSKFLADRFVEGTCPFCQYEDARGDQCDKCSKLINPVELGNPRCKVCSATPIIKTSGHLFLDLPQFEERLQDMTNVRETNGGYNNQAVSITNSWLKTGLKPRCITRDLKWGTPVPHKNYLDKVFYVWFDAPIGYISITANYMEEWELWWKNPKDVTLAMFMAKDNVPFHSVIFPACLMGTKENYTLVDHMDSVDYLQYEGTKFSKSRGVGVFGDNAMTTGIPADIYRCYLLLNRPETSDTVFSWKNLAETNNNILLNNFGNFVLRALTFCKSSFNSEVPEVTLNADDIHFIALLNTHLAQYIKHFDNKQMGRAFESVFAISKIANQYLQYNTPWVLCKGSPADKTRAGSVIGLATNIAALLCVMISPYMPTISSVLQEQLAMSADKMLITPVFTQMLVKSHRIGNPFPLFSKIDEARVAELKAMFGGDQVSSPAPPVAVSTEDLQTQIEVQGNKVRDLKAAKADKDAIQAAVKVLLDLKKQLPAELQQQPAKQGKKAKPAPQQQNKVQNPPKPSVTITPELAALQKEIEVQGNKLRELKASKADKAIIDAEVKVLLGLKSKLPIELQPQQKKGKKK